MSVFYDDFFLYCTEKFNFHVILFVDTLVNSHDIDVLFKNLTFSKGSKNIHWKKQYLFNKGYWKNWICTIGG